MLKKLTLVMLLSIIFTACGSAPASPTPDIPATVAAAAGTSVAATMTAMPTVTLPPTFTPLPSPTVTLAPSDTPAPLFTSTPEASPTSAATPTPWLGTFDPGNTDSLPNAFFRVENHTGQPALLVTLNGITLQRDQPVYYAYQMTNVLNIVIKWGNYNYNVQINGKRTMSGSIRIANKDKTTMYVYPTKIVIVGP